MIAAAVRAGEQSVLAVQRHWADGAFDDVEIDLDTAIDNEARQPFLARQCIPDGFRELGLLADEAELGTKPGFELIDDRLALLVADRATLVGGTTADLGFDGIESAMYSSTSLAIGARPAAASS